MDKSLLIAVVISMGIVVAYTQVYGPKHAAPTASVSGAAATASGATAQPAAKDPANAPTDLTNAKAPATTAKPDAKTDAKVDAKTDAKVDAKTDAAKADGKPATKPEPQTTTLEQPGHFRATFSTWGAAPEHWLLLDPQYKVDNPKEANKEAQPIDLVRTQSPDLPAQVMLLGGAVELPRDAAWTLQPRSDGGDLVFTWDGGDLHVEKRYAPVAGTYETRLTVTVENRGDKPSQHYLRLQMNGWHDPSIKPGGFLSRRITPTQGICDLGGKLKKGNLEELQKKSIDEPGNVRWVGVGEQYFVTAAALKQDPSAIRRCEVYGLADGHISAILTAEQRTVAPHDKTVYEMALFFGPKLLTQLDAVKAGGADAGMGTAVDYGWTEVLARPMLAVLKAIHVVVPNWGVAIIILTILLKALTWFPTMKSMKSMKKMAKLSPEIEKLKARFKDDKQGLNVAMMELYKKEGANPLGGCLPMALQMPIYFALYAMLGNSVELYRSGFVGWIRDLTAPDPYYVLPIATGIIMFLQQRSAPMPTGGAEQQTQQQMMKYIMPVMFTALSVFLASGLSVYIFTNTILTMLQQWWMNRGEKPAPPKVLVKPARA
jgi:YidC/Oxa1 family membrane protein insertase